MLKPIYIYFLAPHSILNLILNTIISNKYPIIQNQNYLLSYIQIRRNSCLLIIVSFKLNFDPISFKNE